MWACKRDVECMERTHHQCPFHVRWSGLTEVPNDADEGEMLEWHLVTMIGYCGITADQVTCWYIPMLHLVITNAMICTSEVQRLVKMYDSSWLLRTAPMVLTKSHIWV